MSEIYARIKRWTGTCASNTQTQDFKDALEKSKNLVTLAFLMSTDSKAVHYFKEAGDKLENISKIIEAEKNICLDIKAAMQIHGAIKVLNDDQVIYKDPDIAAKAFGALFAGFGRLCRYLPPPADQYGQFLEGAGDFFFNMRRGVSVEKITEERWKRVSGLPPL